MRITQRELLVREDGIAYLSDVMSKNYTREKQIKEPQDIYNLMCDIYNLQNKAEEYLYLIVMNSKAKPISIFEISHGNVNSSIIDVRGIMLKTLFSNGVSIALVHNHPSGDTEPSKCDINCTKKIKEACKLMEINLLDHIIIGRNNWTSLKEMELM